MFIIKLNDAKDDYIMCDCFSVVNGQLIYRYRGCNETMDVDSKKIEVCTWMKNEA